MEIAGPILAAAGGAATAVLALWRYRSESKRRYAVADAALVAARSADWGSYAEHLERRIEQLRVDIENDKRETAATLERVGRKLDACEEDRKELALKVADLGARLGE